MKILIIKLKLLSTRQLAGNVPGEPVYEMDCQDDDKKVIIIIVIIINLFELNCDASSCSWKKLPQEIKEAVAQSVMMKLPPGYTSC